MKKKARNGFILSGVFTIVSILFLILIKTVDVQPIGPEGTSVGFATINGALFKLIGTHKLWYYITEVCGVIAILFAVLFAVIGLLQWIKRKSLWKVDKNILALGEMFLLVIALYVIFDKIPVNYRPVVLDEGIEPSFPSTHTMLSCCIIGCSLIELSQIITNKKTLGIIQKVCIGIIAVTVIGRFISGVHWFTDIIGGVLISGAIVSLYYGIVMQIKPERKRRKAS